MIQTKRLVNIQDFQALKKGDRVACEFKNDISLYPTKRKIVRSRFEVFTVYENKESATEIILKMPENIYFNYSMYLFPGTYGVSNLKDILLLESVEDK